MLGGGGDQIFVAISNKARNDFELQGKLEVLVTSN